MKNEKYESLCAEIRSCRLCRLCNTRTQAVPGEGSIDASLMFIGEAPGRNEDLQGKPFVGAAGNLLTEMLAHIGLQRAEVYITNVVKCRPPENRAPLEDEIRTCNPYLRRQIELIQPKLICLLGNFAIRTMLSSTLSATSAHGQMREKNGIKYFCTYHPAAALYTGSLKSVLETDFAKLKILLQNLKKRRTLEDFC